MKQESDEHLVNNLCDTHVATSIVQEINQSMIKNALYGIKFFVKVNLPCYHRALDAPLSTLF